MKQSAGILMYRVTGGVIHVLLVHPGGPFWAGKDAGAWTIPKGEFTDEDPLHAARREFEEETGFATDGEFLPLGSCRLKSGKVVHAWAVAGDVDAGAIRSNTFELRPGQRFPEVDRAEWFTIPVASAKINPAQRAFLGALQRALSKRES